MRDLSGLIEGETVVLEPVSPEASGELAELDWMRGLHPGMAGPMSTSRDEMGVRTMLARSRTTGRAVAVLDASSVLGYDGVRNVSVYADTVATRGAEALEAYGRFVLDELDAGARLIHHEVLELNRSIRRTFDALGLRSTARLRDHAYAAGRHWDVFVYSFDRPTLDRILARAFPTASRREDPSRAERAGGTLRPAQPADPSGGQT